MWCGVVQARGGFDFTPTSGVLEYSANDFEPRVIFIPIRTGNASAPTATATASAAAAKIFAVRLFEPTNAFLGYARSQRDDMCWCDVV